MKILAKLRRDVTAEGVVVPAGTTCNVEQEYPNMTLDLAAVIEGDEILFWAWLSDCEILVIEDADERKVTS
jgi:hypothetical protein